MPYSEHVCAGQLFYIGYSLSAAPYCWVGALDKAGNIEFDCPVELPKGASLCSCMSPCMHQQLCRTLMHTSVSQPSRYDMSQAEELSWCAV